jgi:hypothetical protein
MYWTPPCTRHWTKTGKKQTNTTQYVLDTTIHKTQNEDRKKTKKVVSNTYCVVFFCFFPVFVQCLVHGGVQYILCCVFLFFSCLRPVSCAWWCPIHIVLCLFVFFLSSSSVLCMVVSITYCVVFVCFFPVFVQCLTTQYVLDTTMHKTLDGLKKSGPIHILWVLPQHMMYLASMFL